MTIDIHKPDTSTLVTTGHFYFGWTNQNTTTEQYSGTLRPRFPRMVCGALTSLLVREASPRRRRLPDLEMCHHAERASTL